MRKPHKGNDIIFCKRSKSASLVETDASQLG